MNLITKECQSNRNNNFMFLNCNIERNRNVNNRNRSDRRENIDKFITNDIKVIPENVRRYQYNAIFFRIRLSF